MSEIITSSRAYLLAKTASLAAVAYFGVQFAGNIFTVFTTSYNNIFEAFLIFVFCFVPAIYFYIAYKMHAKTSRKWIVIFESIVATMLGTIALTSITGFLRKIADFSSNGMIVIVAAITALILYVVLRQLSRKQAW